MRSALLLLLMTTVLELLSLEKGQAQNPTSFTVYGTVIDSATQKPINGAAIFLREVRIGSYTDKNGFYGLAAPNGQYTLRVSYLGYLPKIINVKLDQNQILDISLSKDIQLLQEVVVTSSNPEENIKNTETGMAKLSIRSIRKIPAFMGEVDVMRSLQMLPGVSSVGEGSSGLNIRGGSIDQNLVLMDEAPVFNSSHLFGFFSIFNPDAVNDVTLSRGAISAEYGGRTSSVLNVKLKEPDLEKGSIFGGVGVVSSRFGFEAPIIKNKLSILLASRGSINDYLFKLGPNSIKGTIANFYDLTGKILFKPTSNTRLAYTSYYSYDIFKLPGDSLSTVQVNASSSTFRYRTFNQTLKFSWFITPKSSFSIFGVQSLYRAQTSAPDSSVAFTLRSSIRMRSVKARYLHATDKTNLSFGLEANFYEIHPNTLEPGPFSNLLKLEIAPEIARETGAYIEDEWKFSKAFSVIAGLRYSFFQRMGPDTVRSYDGDIHRQETVASTEFVSKNKVAQSYGGFEPRLSLRYALDDNTSIKASYNRMRQYVQLFSNTTAALPTARWGTSDLNLKPQIADQVALGFFKNLNKNAWETSVEIYYRRSSNFPDYRDLANLIFSQKLEQEVIQGQGKAYGIEFMARKNIGFFRGWVTYTYARTKIKMDEKYASIHNYTGAWYPANYDKPHTLNLMMSYRMSSTVTFSANFTYSTGRPATFPYGKFLVNGNAVPIYPTRNLQRIPDFHRLDLSLIIDPSASTSRPKKKWQGSWIISIYNVYGHKNAYSVYSDLNQLQQTNSYKLAIFGAVFPSLTYNFKL